MKSRIVEALGETAIILPSLVAEGLRANEQAKVRMSALQAAAGYARDPSFPPADLSPECRSAGIDAIAIRSLVAGTRMSASGTLEAPGLAKLGEALLADVTTMIRAVGAGDAAVGKAAEDRLATIKSRVSLGDQQISPADVAKLTALTKGGDDSLHRLVMDLHKALNRLAAHCAEEIVAGIKAHGLTSDDKPSVIAFMRGLNRTRGLKFDHPGLDTTAIRTNSRLIIQNDIGTTDAHVLLVSVEGLSMTITHTDIHESRAQFFVSLFDAFPVRWSGMHQEKAEGLGKEGTFYLVTGNYEAETSERRDAFLEAVGAALVFLIDWNKARKVLRRLISNADAVSVLTWAARNQIGHRAFLELGGIDLVASAVRHAVPARIGFGQELGSVLGRESTVEFVKTALKLATEARLNGRSEPSVREALEADLVGRVERNESALLTTVVRQVGLARDIAAGIAANVADGQDRRSKGTSNARRAKHIEEKADAMALEARNAIARTQASPMITQLVNTAENTVDELEQAAFLASLLPVALNPALLKPLGDLCGTAIAATEAAVQGLEAAAGLAEGDSADSADALAATERLVELEHAADKDERAITSVVLQSDADFKTAFSALELARALERASDRLAAIGHLLHAHVMAGLSH
jgi:uncharacterized protein Yka (UPF0111/DUF47 family)